MGKSPCTRKQNVKKTVKKVKIMRTKTMLLSALLGALGSVSVMAQTNVYSLNAVGYINVTITPGFNMISCPLIETPDNTVGTVLNNANSNYNGASVYFWFPTATPPQYSEDTAQEGGKFGTTNADGWFFNGTNVAAPGVGFWFDSPVSNTITFVGTVPTGPITNTLVPGFNLVGSVVPMSGDLISNSLSALTNYNVPNPSLGTGGDNVYTYNSSNTPVYAEYSTASGKFAGFGYSNNWVSPGDPILPFVGEGFWYDAYATIQWVENYSVAQ
jgi:hypothetical protein